MHVPFGRILFGAVMAVHGLVLLGQVYLFPDAGAALRLHRDLAPDADFQFVALKVLFWGLAGLAFLVAGIGISTGKRDWLPAAFVGFLLVDGLYVVQFWMWGSTLPAVWLGFALFGLPALVYAAVARHVWKSTAGLA